MDRQRILEFAAYAGIGGTQRMLAEFLRHASHDRFEYSLCVLLESGFLTEQIADLPVECCCLDMRGYWDMSVLWKLYAFAKNRRFDLLRSYGLKAHIIGRIVGRWLGIPVNITSVRSTDAERKWYHVLPDRLTAPLTDLYLSNSEAGRVSTHQRERIPLAKIDVIPNGIDLAKYSRTSETIAAAAELRRTFGISPAAPVIGVIANFCRMKGHATVVEALPIIRKTSPDMRGLFVGEAFVNEPSYQAELEKIIREKQLERAIVFTGFRQDIPAVLAAIDVFVLPSRWEGLSAAILEAMAMRKPVIATAVGGTPELIENHVTGLLILPDNPAALADAVLFMLNHPDIAQNMGQAGYCRVRDHFSLTAMVEKTEKLYARLIIEKKHG